MELIFIVNIVITDLAKKANIIFIIPNMVLQTYTHSISIIYTIFHNKAKKAFKLGSLAGFT